MHDNTTIWRKLRGGGRWGSMEEERGLSLWSNRRGSKGRGWTCEWRGKKRWRVVLWWRQPVEHRRWSSRSLVSSRKLMVSQAQRKLELRSQKWRRSIDWQYRLCHRGQARQSRRPEDRRRVASLKKEAQPSQPEPLGTRRDAGCGIWSPWRYQNDRQQQINFKLQDRAIWVLRLVQLEGLSQDQANPKRTRRTKFSRRRTERSKQPISWTKVEARVLYRGERVQWPGTQAQPHLRQQQLVDATDHSRSVWSALSPARRAPILSIDAFRANMPNHHLLVHSGGAC